MKRPWLTFFSLLLLSCSGLQSKPVSWTPELVAATQTSFKLPGEWRYTQRSGSEFGSRCDLLFEADGTYRKSCQPPAEESGDWERVGDWDGQTLQVRLRDRVDLIEKRPMDDVTMVLVVVSPDNSEITLDGARWERR